MKSVTILDPRTDDAFFDYDYNTAKHIPMFLGFVGDGIEHAAVSKGDDASPYLCISTLTILMHQHTGIDQSGRFQQRNDQQRQ